MKTGITGGIGTGKSYVCRLLKQRGIAVYDCDEAAKRLIRTSPIIYKELCGLIGSDAFLAQSADGDYVLNKAAVTRFLLQSDRNVQVINDIVHPAVFRDFEESGMEWMESAILFESGINRLVDRVVVVSAPEEVRIARVMKRDGISREKVIQWMQRQWPQDEVRRLSDFEIVNDGVQPLEPQIENIIKQLS